ncbi:MAG: flagellar biosynthetic protein FliQ [Defluviitaleaceae bacterium]|nr:flagellar biosynthetic protein FliQ [Defluviitaleaceae bacterium]
MTQERVLDLAQMTVFTVMQAAAPPLVMGLTVGVLVSMFQTITSIQEPTLAFVPKILAVFMSLVIFGAFMLTTMQEFMIELYGMIPELLIPR